MSIKSEVENSLKKRWEGFKNHNDLISWCNIEKQTNQGYDGRQLLELFQNCEDEGASKVRIVLNTEDCLLEISNDGNKPFSLKGYNSIFYPGLSSKVSSGFIGNKGLGFRSIINWANQINIISNDFEIVFNQDFKKEILLKEIGYSENDLIEIRKERKLNNNVYPLPYLNSCRILELEKPHEFTTTISINYKKEFQEDIINQLKAISAKTLLFLNNINTIEIIGNIINANISVTRIKLDVNNFQINYANQKFFVLSDEGIVDEALIEDKESSEVKKYSVKIAYNDDLSFQDNVLYNYFKTQIPFELPFVAHASLELDQNRNHSTESKVNPFIFKKLFNLHLRFIDILKEKHDKSWLPFQTINKDSKLVYKPYADLIENYWQNFEIYPVLSGIYLKSNEAKNLGNSISKFLESNNLHDFYKNQIVYCNLNIDLNKYIEKPKNYIEIIEKIASNLNFYGKAKFIKLIIENYPIDKFSVLIDEKNEIIPVKDYVYTDKTSDNKELKVPSYSKIRFLHPELYKYLIIELELQNENQKSRLLKDKLERISDVHSFEPQTVIRKIISETNDYLNSNLVDKQNVIKEFYKIIYHNYKLRTDIPKLTYDSRIPCLNQNNRIVDIKTLVLSKEFEIGNLSKKIFDNLYDNDNTIANLIEIGLEKEDLHEVEFFLKWLGINQFTIIEKISSNINPNFINNLNNEHSIRVTSYELFNVKNFYKIIDQSKININKLIAWISIDENINLIFNNFSSTFSGGEKVTYNYYGGKTIRSYKNFIYYSIVLNFKIENYLISSKKEEWFNPFKIDYDYLKEINNKLDKSEVDRILFFFGAKKDFNDLSIAYLKTKTQELADRGNAKGAQVFYKSLVGHYKEKKEKILNVDLYAKEGEKIIVKKSSEIYFSDRIQLPDKLTNKFPLLYYPSRSGGAKAVEMFGLNSLNDLDLNIINQIKNESVTQEFQVFLKEIKPFILAFRLDKITKEDVKNAQVQFLNKLQIKCCSVIRCSIDGEEFDIEPFNYIHVRDSFYFNIPNNITINSLKQNKIFIDNLSDVFLKVFDTLDEKKIFESIIKQSEEDNIYDIHNELAEGILEDAKILLGEISIRLSIWKSIFKLKGIAEVVNLNDNNLEEYISKFFPQIEKNKLFNSNDNLEQTFRIRKIFQILSIDLKEYNNISDYKLSFDKLFQKELVDFYEERKKTIKNQLWLHLKEKSVEEQKHFLKHLYRIEHLLNELSLSSNSDYYNFNQIISDKLKMTFSLIDFELDNNEFVDYDLIEQENSNNFSADELLKIRKDETLNSLSYFENHNDFIKSEINTREETVIVEKSNDFNLDKNLPAELIENFEIELIDNSSSEFNSNNPWLGGSNELSNEQKKKLGLNVEEIIKKYLDSKPDLYSLVEYISKTNEGEHYDIKYYHNTEKKIKFVECKYYNGYSFFISREEKNFADKFPNQYEIWLVNKHSKIFCINDINSLGELQVVNYKANVKLLENSSINN